MTKVFFKTFGCTLNFSDTEIMQGILVDVGFEIVRDIGDSEVVVINTCAVKKPTELKFFRYLKEVQALRKPIVITGCIAQSMPEKLKGFSLLGPDNLGQIVQIIEETMHDNPMTMLARGKNPRLNLPHVRRNKTVEIIPICSGCMGECSYCVVKHARGGFYSYDQVQIVKQAKSAIRDGVKEIWLTAQDTGCYGKDIGSHLSTLLHEIVNLPGDFKIRVGMMNPNHVLNMLNDLIEVYKSDKIYKFLHIPVQSGNNDVLKKMKRQYSADDFTQTVNKFRKEFQRITIATDIICGFPGESEKQFNDTMDLVNETRPDIINISRYWPRPHTSSEKLRQVPGSDIKRRSGRLTTAFKWITFENNKTWRKWEGEILIDEKGI